MIERKSSKMKRARKDMERAKMAILKGITCDRCKGNLTMSRTINAKGRLPSFLQGGAGRTSP